MRNAAVIVIASLLFTGCSNYWWLARALLPDHTINGSGGTQTLREPRPNPSSEPVYGPDRSSDAPDAKQQDEAKAANDTP
ncbi:hypothetical protein LXT21_31015 [Myxococcus sp. K38C18041901]|uniref:hypothetical protein n=1 Tax=Myxococcus guangdongensis TaxID=2906760 RepID=UPI0020A74635|nr:hypothetical protein [Myxococcus guangdongensis]MCP3063217.1 hypothetical protein [Myxococcus guangdongensis]